MDGFGSCNPWLAILRQTRDTDRLKLDEAVAVGELDVPSKDKFDIVFQDEEPLERTTTSSLDEPMRPDVTELSALALQGDDNTQGIFSDAARSSSPEPMEEQETEDEGTPDQLPVSYLVPPSLLYAKEELQEDGEGKLKELKKEFGPITYSDSSQVESEQYDCETTAALIIGVLVKG